MVSASSALRVSAECSRLHPTDAVLLIDMQNCFMEERAVRTGQAPSYSLEGFNDTLPSGPLQVADSTGIIDVANEWMGLATEAGAKTMITLDWHPADHCSFCNIESGGVAAPFFCYSGSVIVHAYNESLRCVDAVSSRDWDYQQYYQWASHCVAGSFDARLDPYLAPPDDAIYVKLGVHRAADSYSGFDGGRKSAAAPHDTQQDADSLANLDDAAIDLDSLITSNGVRRLFMMGLATDFVVKNTMLDSIGANDAMPTTYEHNRRPDGLQQSVLVDAATRGIFELNSLLAKEAFERGGGTIVLPTAAADALAELCAGTCDTHDDCDAATEHCVFDVPRVWEWGNCVLCPGDGCGGHGACSAAGTCDCELGYAGDGCEDLDSTLGFIVGGMLLLVIVLLLLGFYLYRKARKAAGEVLRSALTMKPICLARRAPGVAYDLFLSHTWATGQDTAHYMKRELTRLVPTLRIFLDVDDLKDVSRLEEHIGESAVVLLLLTKGYFLSRNCMREVLATVKKSRPVIIVHCDNAKKGGASLDDLRGECPSEELRRAIFDHDAPLVPWKALSDQFNYLSLKMIAQRTLEINLRMLNAPPSSADKPGGLSTSKGSLTISATHPSCDAAESSSASADKSLTEQKSKGAGGKGAEKTMVSRAMLEIQELCRRGECDPHEEFELSEQQGLRLFCSAHNDGAARIGGELVQRVRGLQLASGQRFEESTLATHFLLVLNQRTFTDDVETDDVDEAAELVAECRLAFARKVPFVLVHQMDGDDGCSFDHILHVTPRGLLTAGLYKEVATPWIGLHEEFKHKAVETIASSLGARRRQSSSWGLLAIFQQRNRRINATQRAIEHHSAHSREYTLQMSGRFGALHKASPDGKKSSLTQVAEASSLAKLAGSSPSSRGDCSQQRPNSPTVASVAPDAGEPAVLVSVRRV